MRIHTLLEYRWQDGRLALVREEGFDYSGPLALCDRSKSGQIANQSTTNSQADQNNAQNELGAVSNSLSDYTSKLNNFMKFGRSTYGANGEFMKDENTLANTTAAAGTTNIKGNLALNALRTGANTAGYADTAAESQRQGEEAVTSQLANADASRLQQLTNINEYGVQASALPAEVNASLYGTSVGASNNALGVATSASSADPSFADTLPGDLTAAIGAAGQVGAGFTPNCPAEGSLYLMADGTERAVETLRVGEQLAGIDGEPETIDKITSVWEPTVRVTTENGLTLRNSLTHCYVMRDDGFTLAIHSQGKQIVTGAGVSKVVSVQEAGIAKVFNVETNGSHSYRADGAWALGVGHIESDEACECYLKTNEHLLLPISGGTCLDYSRREAGSVG